jgi:hypothetical protein
MGSGFSAGFVLGMLGTYISTWLNGYRRIAADQASTFSFELLQFPVVAQPFPNCRYRNDQQNDHGEADSEGEAVRKQDHSGNLSHAKSYG